MVSTAASNVTAFLMPTGTALGIESNDFAGTNASQANVSYERPFDEVGIGISAAVIFTFLVVGLIANTLTIAVILSYEVLSSNVFMRFILSLCVSDLISALISWLFLYRRTWGFDDWAPLPDIFCKFYWSADYMTSYVTALHIFSFAILRLISMKWPFLYNKMKMLHANTWIGLIWLVCFACAFIPIWIMFGPSEPQRNSSQPNARFPACTVLSDKVTEYRYFQNITFPIFLYVPTVGVVSICIFIIVLVKTRAKKVKDMVQNEQQQQKEKQAVLQLVLIICAFLLGYIPFTAYELWSIQEFPNTRYYYFADYWFGMAEYMMLRFSECLNPLFYNLGSAKMRGFTRKFCQEKIFNKFHDLSVKSQTTASATV